MIQATIHRILLATSVTKMLDHNSADENNITQKLKRAEKKLAEAYNPGEV